MDLREWNLRFGRTCPVFWMTEGEEPGSFLYGIPYERTGDGSIRLMAYGSVYTLNLRSGTFRVTDISRLQSEYTEFITCESQEDVQTVVSLLEDANVSYYVNPNKQIVYVSKRDTAAANLALGAAGYFN